MTLLFIAFLLSSTAHVAGGQMQHTDLPANEWKTREQDTSDTVDDGDVNPTGWVDGIHQIIDSLQQLNSTQALSKKQEMQIYTQIADKYHTIETDSSIAYRIKTITLARELNDFEELMKAYYSMAIDHIFKGNFDTAFDYLKQANDLALKHRNKEMEAAVLNSTGYAYMKQGKYNMAIDYYLKYLKMSENEGWTYNCIRALANLGEINRRLGNTEQSFQYLKQAEEINNQLYPVSSDWLMPHIYNEYAFNYLNLGDYDEALHHALKADSIVLPFGTINRCYTKGILASIYLHRNDYERALQNAQESFEQANILKAANLYINAGKILSDIYLAQKRYREAETEAIKAWQIDTTNIDESRALIHNIALANIYMGNKEKAAYYLNKYS
jgi:tetratricopeptide (TPR) repeat protein